ncbi:CDC27 family protein [Campylobacter sp. RM9328]|uniref:CDC27 family protein n=1 Tax=Campylobacter sp. RM9328 TaxID=1705720 RepID=UPI001473C91C|nr:CDC27 family protein [Campylobacter sp. RM9328]
MLSTQEIRELEKRYEAYIASKKPKISNQTKLIIILILATVLATSGFYALNTKQNDQKPDTISSVINESKQKSINAKERFEEKLKEEELISKVANKLEENLRHYNASGDKILDIKPSDTKNESKTAPQGWLKLKVISSSDDADNTPLPKNQILDFDENVAKEQPKTQKSKIDIQIIPPKDELSSLKESFAATNNQSYALEVARINFKNKNYNEAIKWALTANEIDSNTEESWVIFAKSKYYTGNKNDALKALKEYNKKQNKATIDVLIKKIESGSL